MFTQSVPAPAPAPSSSGLHAAASSPTPASPTRTSRLRGLSYLRSYTQSHLLNREHSNGGSASSPPANAAASAAPTEVACAINSASSIPSPSSIAPLSDATSSHGLVRSDSYPLGASSSALSPVTATAGQRFSLVPAVLHPLITSPTVGALPSDDLETGRQGASIPPSLAPVALVPAADPSAPLSTAAAAAITSSQMPATTDAMTRPRSATDASIGASHIENLPSIRFSTFYDSRSARPSLKFAPMSRTLPTGKEVIRVGRYSERDSQPSPNPNVPSAAHVGFKSKVVSRRHCEFWFESSRWFIKDVKSSSGTFLNHIRLSQPGTESKPFPINDGDIVQLGIDFKGGEEMIFRCVKMRVELNRGWQNKLNAFNLNTHKRLRNMTKTDGDGSTQSSQDCSICLNSIAPCQSLFVAPCSHTWHYKCIRSLLESPQYPSFICPNCRAAVDLEADVEDPPEEWEQMEVEDAAEGTPEHCTSHALNATSAEQPAGPIQALAAPAPLPPLPAETPNLPDTTMHVLPMQVDTPTALPVSQPPPLPTPTIQSPPQPEQPSVPVPVESHATSNPMPIPAAPSLHFPSANASGTSESAAARDARTPSPEHHVAPHGHEGPITPRNDAGPWVFDGSGIRIGSSRASIDSRRGEMRSLDTATAEVTGLSPN